MHQRIPNLNSQIVRAIKVKLLVSIDPEKYFKSQFSIERAGFRIPNLNSQLWLQCSILKQIQGWNNYIRLISSQGILNPKSSLLTIRNKTKKHWSVGIKKITHIIQNVFHGTCQTLGYSGLGVQANGPTLVMVKEWPILDPGGRPLLL